MTDLKSKTLPELTDFLKSMGQPAFRGKQVFTWLHRGVRSFEEMTNLPKALRDQLAAVLDELRRIEAGQGVSDELLDTIQMIATIMNGMQEDFAYDR